eukprot:CAMPEP_0168193190 /NCGR_PEP_ID=MMETSP0139_2-20121125/18463_1 /TAXON_ID=44445 /ORGANISM="Pseudo-nitzschia australis, Strain 10249 10 AB" /LENGTH=219 /DNA_ID=CAMNT_0008116507 /DNA_START=207 /DNA_END=866 /DNA_ORIENTATION=+
MRITTQNNRSSASFLILLALLVAISTNTNNGSVHAFTSMHRVSRSSSSDLARSPSFLGMSDSGKDDEIAKLEEQLRKLKEEKGTEVSPANASETKEEEATAVTTTAAATTTTKTAEDDEEMSEDEASMDMFLSEGWKEARSNYDPSNTATKKRQDEEQGNLIGTVTKVVGGILALVIFSQIPVGQEDLSKYSAIKSGPATSTIDLGDTNRVKGQTSGDL